MQHIYILDSEPDNDNGIYVRTVDGKLIKPHRELLECMAFIACLLILMFWI